MSIPAYFYNNNQRIWTYYELHRVLKCRIIDRQAGFSAFSAFMSIVSFFLPLLSQPDNTTAWQACRVLFPAIKNVHLPANTFPARPVPCRLCVIFHAWYILPEHPRSTHPSINGHHPYHHAHEAVLLRRRLRFVIVATRRSSFFHRA